MKIVAASDSHGRRNVLENIVRWEPDADLYLHCGDLEDDPRNFPEWLFVKGNNDWMYEMPLTREVCFQGLPIFMCHGHTFPYSCRQQAIAQQAALQGCRLALYGHTHVHDDWQKGNVRLVNPGSCWMSRDGRPASYAVITVDEKDIQVEFRYEDQWPKEPGQDRKKKRWFHR